MKRKRRRIRWGNVILFLIILTFIVTLIISSINIIKWSGDSQNTNNNIDKVQENTQINEVSDSEETEIIETEEEIPKDSPYWTYIKMNLIDVNFNDLNETNNQTVGWIQVNGTNINYPFVQTTDNEFYLTHTFDKSYNKAGWVFMDYRNNKDEYNKNTILYAHGRADNTMFGSLKKVIFKGWLNNSNNHVIKLSTQTENTLWQVFSVYKIPTTNDYIQVEFATNEEFIEFGNMLINRSVHNFNTNISAEDKILTLSSCYNDDDKVVLHAKLIKREKKA